ncbi:MAG TPA: PAS domain S-box protein [Candidatus Thermoplasmatota archaeon]|nr:PAS domain S-box protein [Candidatus Thermoplasmatota archaeon]
MDGPRERAVEPAGPRRLRPWRRRASHGHETAPNLLAAIVDFSDDAIVTKDLRGMVMSWNNGAERIFGYTAAEMVGQSIVRLFPPDRVGEEASILARIQRGERVDHFETKRVRKDGTVIDVSVTISPLFDASGTLVGASKIARDITERKQSERERSFLAAIVRSSSDAICTKSPEGIVTSWNPGSERLFGYLAPEIIGRHMEVLFPPSRRAEIAEILAAVRAGRSIEHHETQRLHKDGHLVDVSVTTSPLRASDGAVVGASEVAQDVTERKRLHDAERERAAAEIRNLRDLEAFRSRFINSAAHELSNPLTPIAIQLRLLRHRASGPEVVRSVDILERNFQRLSRGIRDLLDAARIEGHRLVVARKPVDLRALVEEATESFAPAAQAVGVRLRCEPIPAVTVEADEGRLMQVLYNLLSNAVKFTPPDGEVVLSAHVDQWTVRLCVRDTGIGIAPEHLERLFHPYRQVHDPKLSPGTGMGLGLYISRALVQAHGGRIWADSPGPGKGTTMCIELPLELPPPRSAGSVG